MHDKSAVKHHAIIAWAEHQLQAQGYTIQAPHAVVQQNPWSSVIKFTTIAGCFYLKQTPPNLFIEPEIIQALRDKCNFTAIPTVIAVNNSLHCFLMQACGDVPLRTLFADKFQPDILIKGIETYIQLQKSSLKHVDHFIKLGAPDWRLEKFPSLYNKLLCDDQFLVSENISPDLKQQLLARQPVLAELCEKLAAYNVPESLNHSDFHDNNILIDLTTKQIAIIDLGETAIDHPFFSLAANLRNAVQRYHLKPEDELYKRILTVSFGAWLAKTVDLQQALDLTEKILPIYLTFAHARLVASTRPEELSAITRMNDRIKQGFEWFIKITTS